MDEEEHVPRVSVRPLSDDNVPRVSVRPSADERSETSKSSSRPQTPVGPEPAPSDPQLNPPADEAAAVEGHERVGDANGDAHVEDGVPAPANGADEPVLADSRAKIHAREEERKQQQSELVQLCAAGSSHSSHPSVIRVRVSISCSCVQEDILPSTGRLSHYEVQRQIGSGRFSTVFRAKAIKDNGRLVAMKKIQVPDSSAPSLVRQ